MFLYTGTLFSHERPWVTAVYKCVLADDEPLDLKGLQRLIDWNSLGIEVTAAAGSGFVALEFLRREKADILITDIKMPIMSGLELARQALELQPQIKLIFISGFEDFQFAQRAIELSAFGYLLKPVDEGELYVFLQKLRLQLDKEKEQLAFERSMPLIRNELIARWLEGEGEPDELVVLLDGGGRQTRSKCNRTSVVEIDDLSWKLNPYPKEQRDAVLQKIYDYIEVQCRKYELYPVQVDHHRIALLYRDSEDNKPYLPVFQSIVTEAREHIPLTLTIAVGERVAGMREMPSSYRSAVDALFLKLFVGKSRLIISGEPNHHMVREVRNLNEVLEELFEAMNGYELVRIDDSLQLLFSIARGMEEKLQVHHFSLHLIARLEQYLVSKGENFYALLDIEFSNLDVLYQFETIADIQSWLRRRLFEISEKLNMKKSGKNSKLVEEMMKYVAEHISDSFTLKDVAHTFSFSPNYLGYLFKEETGENFSDYVIRKRLDQAKELLRDPKRKIYEVASEIGYKNFTVFNRQFRKFFGIAPGDYRKRI